MGLATDSIFVTALKSNEQLMEAVGGSIYGTAIPMPDEQLLNAELPYIIVTFDGLTNGGQTKDHYYEGNTDEVRIGVLVAASELDGLYALTEEIRRTILRYVLDNETDILDYHFSAEEITYDSLKPCYWQNLNWVCDVQNHVYERADDNNEN